MTLWGAKTICNNQKYVILTMVCLLLQEIKMNLLIFINVNMFYDFLCPIKSLNQFIKLIIHVTENFGLFIFSSVQLCIENFSIKCWMSFKGMKSIWIRSIFFSAQLERTLGTFYAPSRPLSEVAVLEYRDSISRFARRFFHHLLRLIYSHV